MTLGYARGIFYKRGALTRFRFPWAEFLFGKPLRDFTVLWRSTQRQTGALTVTARRGHRSRSLCTVIRDREKRQHGTPPPRGARREGDR